MYSGVFGSTLPGALRLSLAQAACTLSLWQICSSAGCSLSYSNLEAERTACARLPLPASIQARAIQGIRSQLDRFYLSGRSPTLREIATRKVSLDSMPFIGTPQRVADSLARTIEAVGGDGFAIRQGLWPGYIGPFVEQVVPLLQQHGVARAEYTGTTLREHLREF